MVTPEFLFIMIMFAMLEVSEVGLMTIGFLFKADMAVSLQRISVLNEQDKPFHHIPDEERDIKQFPLLGDVYQLMVEFRLTQLSDRKDESTQADGNEIFAHRVPLDENLLIPHCKP